MNMIELEINGIPVSVKPGTSLIDAAKLVGVKIPTLCYHSDLEPWAACGICVVKVEGSPKLLKLLVDFGSLPSLREGSQADEAILTTEIATPSSADSAHNDELQRDVRQIISGIAKSYEPEFLVGKEALFIVNLEPREIMGLMSNGMILCATKDGLPVILQPEKEVAPGALIK